VSNGSPRSGTLVREFELTNQYGLHARPAALFVKTASRFDADVTVEKDGTRVSGKSIMGLMTLQASCGSTLKVSASGAEAGQLLTELATLIQKGFGEE